MQMNTAQEPALAGRRETIMTYDTEACFSGYDAGVANQREQLATRSN
jgi:hypothetical protein